MRVKTKEENEVLLESTITDQQEKIKQIAILMRVYTDKVSNEIRNIKAENQISAIEFEIQQINPKYCVKSKNYGKMQQNLEATIKNYKQVLEKYCYYYDFQIEEELLKKVELENQLLMAIMKKIILKNEAEKIAEKKEKKGLLKNISAVFEKIKKKGQVDSRDVRHAQDRI